MMLAKIIEGLEEKELEEALDFIDFLKERKKRTGRSEFIGYIKSIADSNITLSRVKKELSTIQDKAISGKDYTLFEIASSLTLLAMTQYFVIASEAKQSRQHREILFKKSPKLSDIVILQREERI